MENSLYNYIKLVPFLGVVFGDHCEVALLDCSTQKIIAIANGHISGRSIGAPMTDLAEKMMNRRDWEHKDFVANYPGYTASNKLLNASTYFIKQNGNLLGMLCINIDTSDFQKISDIALTLGKLLQGTEGGNTVEHETFLDGVSHTITQVLYNIYGKDIPSVFTREERIAFLTQLQERGIFSVKGSVPHVAKVLGCSEPTIYRDLSKINSFNDHDTNFSVITAKKHLNHQKS